MIKIFLAGFVLFTLVELAQAKVVGSASFHAEGEGLALDIDGADAVVESDLKNGSNIEGTEFLVHLLVKNKKTGALEPAFKTGIELRDEHMCKALECSKFPVAKFVLSNYAKGGPVSGELTLHGVTKKVQGWTAKSQGSKILVSGKISLADYGIKPPEYKAAKVSDSVEVSVEVTL